MSSFLPHCSFPDRKVAIATSSAGLLGSLPLWLLCLLSTASPKLKQRRLYYHTIRVSPNTLGGKDAKLGLVKFSRASSAWPLHRRCRGDDFLSVAGCLISTRSYTGGDTKVLFFCSTKAGYRAVKWSSFQFEEPRQTNAGRRSESPW